MTLKPTPAAFAAAQHLQRIKTDAEQALMDKVKKIDVRQLVLHASGQATMTFMEPAERFDECIVGTAEVGGEVVAVYNKTAVILALADMQQCTFEQAFDTFTASVALRKLRPIEEADGQKLPQQPLFVVDLRDFVA